MYDPADGAVVQAAIVERESLNIGETVAGLAVIAEPQTTTVLGSHHVAVVEPDLSLASMGESS